MTMVNVRMLSRRTTLAGIAGAVAAAGGNLAANTGTRTALDTTTVGYGKGRLPIQGALAPFRARIRSRDSQPVVLVFAGSSTTQGGAVAEIDRWVTIIAGGWPLVTGYANSLASGPHGSGLTFLNMGAGGEHALSYIRAADIPTIGGWNPALVAHSIGANDATATRGTPERVASEIAKKIDGIDDASTKPVTHILMHQHERADGKLKYAWGDFLPGLHQIAAARPNVAVLDTTGTFAALRLLRGDPLGLFLADKIHLGVAGNQVYADMFSTVLDLPEYTAPGPVLFNRFERANGPLTGTARPGAPVRGCT